MHFVYANEIAELKDSLHYLSINLPGGLWFSEGSSGFILLPPATVLAESSQRSNKNQFLQCSTA